MNAILWVGQAFIAIAFFYSGLNKSFRSERDLVTSGQTGVEGLPLVVIRSIGVAEIVGAIGIVLPWMTMTLPQLAPIAALALGAIMIPAAMIHYRRNEKRSVLVNIFLLLLCGLTAVGRFESL